MTNRREFNTSAMQGKPALAATAGLRPAAGLLRRYSRKVMAATANDVERAASKYVRYGNVRIIAVGDWREDPLAAEVVRARWSE
jgi:hypothetical protein